MPDNKDDSTPFSEKPTLDKAAMDDSSQSFRFAPGVRTGSLVPSKLGDYSVRRMIGHGGMGNVYLAEHTRMARSVAIKTLPVERMKTPGAIDQFYSEVRAASQLMHPNIVTAFDAGESEGVHYLVMEYVDGQTLTQVVAENGPLSLGEAASVITQAALGLHHSHRAGIVHRDVKPGNLMRAADGTIKVLDLGLARIGSASLIREDRLARKSGNKGRLFGTLPYMSPEQLEDPESVDARSDIYSLGATMYFLLIGRPLFEGEYLDIVEAQSQGEIPDLMQSRADVDLQFSNLFRRMVAISRSERYASLDEVIDDLSGYTSQQETPSWLAGYTQTPVRAEQSTVGSGSTTGVATSVFAIDFGMTFAAAAEASPLGEATMLPAGGDQQLLFRNAIASPEQELCFGMEAMKLRDSRPHRLVHCLPLYIGQEVVDREIAGRQCPPEVLMAMALRRIKQNAWKRQAAPQATAITIPSSYDQLHRQSVMLAARIAKFSSVRLVDRSVAAAQSLMVDASDDQLSGDLVSESERNLLFVGVTGHATEVAVLRQNSQRFEQLSSDGHWLCGSMPWLHRLIELAAAAFVQQYGKDPRDTIRHAARLQVACERAMHSMLMLKSVAITIRMNGINRTVKITRQQWLQTCHSLADQTRRAIDRALSAARVKPDQIDTCLALGPLLQIGEIRDIVLADVAPIATTRFLDRTDIARGAAVCLASELPGRKASVPARGVTSQDIGIVVQDAEGRHKILPILPKGSSLPARINRKLSGEPGRNGMPLTIVESAGLERDEWHELGRYEFDLPDSQHRMRMIAFEVGVNGILTVRAQEPGTPASIKMPSLPKFALTEEAIAEWTDWLDGLF